MAVYFRENLLKNWQLKLIALIFALLLWFHVKSEREYVIEASIPLRVAGYPDYLSLTEPPPESLTVRLMGKGKVLLPLTPTRLKAEVVLNQAEKGVGSYRLSQKDIQIPENYDITVIGIYNPHILTYELDSLKTREVRVSPVFSGKLPTGYVHTGDLDVYPPLVSLRGPAKVIRSRRQVSSGAIALESRTNSFTVDVAVRNDHPFIQVDPETVTVTYSIERIIEKNVEGLAVTPFAAPRNIVYTVEPERIDLVVKGAESLVSGLDVEKVEVKINLRGLDRGTHDLLAEISLPPGIVFVSAEPKSFRVTVE